MPESSTQLHLRHYDVYDDSKPALELPRRAFSSSPNNEPRHHKMSLIRQLMESLPEREREMKKDDYLSVCTMSAKKGYDRRSGRSVMVFKRSRPNRKKQPCGLPDCRACGVFWRMEMDDLERGVPGLVSAQNIQKQSLRQRVCASPASSLSTPTSSLSSIPPTLSSATTSTSRSPYKIVKDRKPRHREMTKLTREMTKLTDGSEWIPATLERVQAYIASQGERRLPLSYRLVVARRAEDGSSVGAGYEKAIQEVDLKVGRKPQTRAEVLSRGMKDFPEDGYQDGYQA